MSTLPKDMKALTEFNGLFVVAAGFDAARSMSFFFSLLFFFHVVRCHELRVFAERSAESDSSAESGQSCFIPKMMPAPPLVPDVRLSYNDREW